MEYSDTVDKVRALDLKTERFAVIGAGALGNEVIKLLCLLGLKNLIVIDPDTVEESNLARSVFYREPGCIGTKKAQSIADVAKRLYPDTQIIPICSEVADVGSAILASSRLWFSCVHSELARTEIAYLSTRLRIPVVDGALGLPDRSKGHVSWFPPTGACFGCGLPAGRRRELLSVLDTTTSPCGEIIGDGSFPSTPTMASIIGGIQVEVGFRSFFDCVPEAFTVQLSLGPDPRLDVIRRKRTEACPFHWVNSGRNRPLKTATITVESFLGEAKADSGTSPFVLLDWPVCVQAACRDCQFTWAPMCRIAVFRRTAVCPQCNGRSILELKSIRAIESGSEWASLPFAAFGVPDSSLIMIRASQGMT
jgi:hypothetical protein